MNGVGGHDRIKRAKIKTEINAIAMAGCLKREIPGMCSIKGR